MTDTKHKFSSFSAPTRDDMEAWNALPEHEKRDLILAEIDKGLADKATPVTSNTPAEIKARVMARYSQQ